MHKPLLSLVASLIFSLPAYALTAEDIQKQVEAKLGKQNQIQALLNDPDPQRSLAAMEAMLESGDANNMRQALEFGIYSPNPQVRHLALKGYFDSKPVLRFFIDGSKVKDKDYFLSSVRDLQGSVEPGDIGFAVLQVGDYDEERRCYQQHRSNGCFVRLSETEVAVSPWSNLWYQTQLDDSGRLNGFITFGTPAPFYVPITF